MNELELEELESWDKEISMVDMLREGSEITWLGLI